MSTNNVESESKITFLIKFKKGNTVTLTDVKKLKLAQKLSGTNTSAIKFLLEYILVLRI